MKTLFEKMRANRAARTVVAAKAKSKSALQHEVLSDAARWQREALDRAILQQRAARSNPFGWYGYTGDAGGPI